jgi:hypothetical protein
LRLVSITKCTARFITRATARRDTLVASQRYLDGGL